MASLFRQGWKDELLSLNQWVGPHLNEIEGLFAASAPLRSRAANRARMEAVRRRMARGRVAWNVWATAMSNLFDLLPPHARVLRLWDYAAAVDLDGDGPLDLAGFVFPGAVRVAGRVAADDFCATHAEFLGEFDARNAVFTGEAAFECATFHREAGFGATLFMGPAQFRDATFLGAAGFREAAFDNDAWFRGAQFDGPLDASAATFKGEAAFGNCRFAEEADFSGAEFEGNAGFDKARFDRPARFCDARFHRAAWFNDARMDAATRFDRARFAVLSDFNGLDAYEAQPSPVARMITSIEEKWRDAQR